MAGWSVRQFRGVAPRAEPRLLQDNQAQVAQNCKLWHGSLRPLSSNLAVSGTPLTISGPIKTIYRFGHDLDSDTQYWFQRAYDVDFCRGAIFEDTTERTYFTDGTLPKVTDSSIALAGGTDYPMNSYTLGVPKPTPCTATVTGTADPGATVAETWAYSYTYVTGWGEEGKPADAATVDVLPGQTVDITGLAVAPVGNYNITTKRIYRSATVDAEYKLVMEIPVATIAVNDAVLTEDLGGTLPSLNFDMPPASLKGLINLPNGMTAGFSGKDVYFCEPYKPYAYPVGYAQTVDSYVVGLGSIDTTLVVLTKGFPFLMQGASPDAITVVKADLPQACVSKRSIASMAGGVVYASPDGLFLIGGGGPPTNLTEAIFTNNEWRTFFNPSSMDGYVYDNKYICFYDNGTTQGGFILDPVSGDFTTLDFYATAGYYDPQRDSLFLVINGTLVKFDQGASSLTATWKSKVFYSPRPVCLGAIRIEAAAYPIPVQIFVDGSSIGWFTINSKLAQRLPGGYLANTFEVQIKSRIEVYSFSIAESMGDLING